MLCTDRYATASDCNGEGSGPKADWWADITTSPPRLGDTITFGKCQKKKKERKMNKMITYNRTAQSAECSVNISELIPLMHIKL